MDKGATEDPPHAGPSVVRRDRLPGAAVERGKPTSGSAPTDPEPAGTSQRARAEPHSVPTERKPAEENPWYVLATIHGEQGFGGIDSELERRNRQSWNRWLLGGCSPATKAHLIALGVEPADLVELSEVEYSEIVHRATSRLQGRALPNQGQFHVKPNIMADSIYFDDCVFSRPLNMAGFVFPGNVHFVRAEFASRVSFYRAKFLSVVFFNRARFLEGTWFTYCTFEDGAQFSQAYFGDTVTFEAVKFRGETSFISAEFRYTLRFDFVDWSYSPDFRDSKLPFSTTWGRVRWPKTRRRSAFQEVEHYAALRHAMDSARRFDAELDFFVRELKARRFTGMSALRRGAIEIYLLISDGGRSLGRPLAVWLILILLAWTLTNYSIRDEKYVGSEISLSTIRQHINVAADLDDPLTLESLYMTLSSAFVVGVPILDVRKREHIALKVSAAGGVQELPLGLLLLGLVHAGLSACCFFLMALAVRNWLRIK